MIEVTFFVGVFNITGTLRKLKGRKKYCTLSCTTSKNFTKGNDDIQLLFYVMLCYYNLFTKYFQHTGIL